MTDIIKQLENEQLRDDIPEFAPGDTVRVLYLVREGAKERIQAFEGVCIARTNKSISSSFTVRKISFGEGVERKFPMHSPVIDTLNVVSKGVVKRAKLYYLRDRVGKAARVKRQQTQ